VVFLDDGRVEMDTNVVERAIRPHTLTRKNALFAGSNGGARHWAIAMTLIQTAKLNGIDQWHGLRTCWSVLFPAAPRPTICTRCYPGIGPQSAPPKRPLHGPRSQLSRQFKSHRSPPHRLRLIRRGAI
jgi:hypothetical protein